MLSTKYLPNTRVGGAFLVIDAANAYVTVFLCRIAIHDSSAGIGRVRQFHCKGYCRFAEQRGIDAVVDKRRSQRYLSARIACRRGEGREITGQHGRCGNERNEVRWILANFRTLITTEEKDSVSLNRPAQRSAELVAFDAVAHGRESISGIEYSIADKLKQIAMKLVRARFRHQAHRASGLHTTLRRRRAGLDLELLQRIRKGHGYVAVVVHVVVIGPVQRVIQSLVQSAGDRKTGPGESVPGIGADEGRRRRGSGKTDQLHYVPSVQGQIKDARVLNNLADTNGSCFYQGCIRLHLHLLAHLTDFQYWIDHRAAAYLQHDSSLRECTKSRQGLPRADMDPVADSAEHRIQFHW